LKVAEIGRQQPVERSLTSDRLALAKEVARVPEKIRGFGHVKERSVKAARARWADLMQRWNSPAGAEAHTSREQARAA
jgi:indolepyruvate ferredoxin oxidoreductase